jgi:hypothetical protein
MDSTQHNATDEKFMRRAIELAKKAWGDTSPNPMVGAVLVANNYKMRALVKKGQQEVVDKLDSMMDKTLENTDEETDEKQSKTKRARTKKQAE